MFDGADLRGANVCLAQVAIGGVLGRDLQVLPFSELVGERVVAGGQVFDPLAHFRDLLACGHGEFVALGAGGRRPSQPEAAPTVSALPRRS